MNGPARPSTFLNTARIWFFSLVVWRLRYKLSLRDLAEMFLTRGFAFTHETVRDWECGLLLCLLSACARSSVDERACRGIRIKRT